MKVLVTGGAGYIGSTTVRALEDAGHEAVIIDSLVTGPKEFIQGRAFYQGDIADRQLLARALREHPDIESTVHMAARVVVSESVSNPTLYYRENVAKSVELFETLVELGKPKVVFSSSASVYAMPTQGFEVTEDSALAPASPYARTKRMMEQILEDMANATDLRAVILRYFNPIGADPQLRTGIHVREPSHVLGQLVMAATGKKSAFTITGSDLPTRDGTGVRDYIHVWDLAQAHVATLEQFDSIVGGARSEVLNVGTGEAVTVRELVRAFERVHGSPVPTVEGPARPGDAIGAYANVDRIHALTGWVSRHSLEEGVDSALRWAGKRPGVLGYP